MAALVLISNVCLRGQSQEDEHSTTTATATSNATPTAAVAANTATTTATANTTTASGESSVAAQLFLKGLVDQGALAYLTQWINDALRGVLKPPAPTTTIATTKFDGIFANSAPRSTFSSSSSSSSSSPSSSSSSQSSRPFPLPTKVPPTHLKPLLKLLLALPVRRKHLEARQSGGVGKSLVSLLKEPALAMHHHAAKAVIAKWRKEFFGARPIVAPAPPAPAPPAPAPAVSSSNPTQHRAFLSKIPAKKLMGMSTTGGQEYRTQIGVGVVASKKKNTKRDLSDVLSLQLR
jgi:hypothetical protein